MIHTRLINSSVCLKQPRRLSAKGNRRSRRSSAGWSKSRNRKTRSSRITKSVMDVPPTPVCYWLKSIEVHQQQFGHAPRLIAADAAFNWTKDRRSGPQNGGQTVSHSASFHQEYRVASVAKEKMVPTSTSLANRIGRSDQCGQTPTRIESLSISRRCRHETMGWIGCDRGQPDQYRKNLALRATK